MACRSQCRRELMKTLTFNGCTNTSVRGSGSSCYLFPHRLVILGIVAHVRMLTYSDGEGIT